MKYMKKIISTILICLPFWIGAQVEVTYRLTYDFVTQTYTMAMRSNTAFNPPLSRMPLSVQVTIVVPHIAGGWQISNFTPLVNTTVPLQWGMQYLDGTTEGVTDDYMFFAPANAGTYTPFVIPANEYLDLFSFQSNSGCVGDLNLYEIDTDPLADVVYINAGHNMVILGAGPGNKYVGNDSGDVSCLVVCSAEAGTLSY